MPHFSAMIKAFFLSLVATLSLSLQAAPAKSLDDMVTVSVLPGWTMADGSHVAALKFVLKDGWKTYWRAPGEAGIPPHFNWSGSRNVAGVTVEWPTPVQTVTNGMRTIGYRHSLVLPIRLTPAKAGQPIHLAAELEIGVCSDICVPVTLSIAQDLPRGVTRPDPQIAAALASRPYTAKEARVGRVVCRVTPVKGGLHVVAEVDMEQMGKSELAVLETDNPDLWVAQAVTSRNGNRLRAETEIFHAEGHSFALNRSGLRITILSSGDAVDIRGCPAG
ncbi:Thiol-disulfide interchange protein, contains DsbC and DsbD domains [Roseovarius marisflavi]|uniref:Thiol-disulfide interchange protein, contains DsbC and DsbD domains n=2 Tax=Roseovarius marisflavi TaxID=1054996 RepID=A0A1M7AGF9_9RHOB|nr:Thiol-disulfide interchange protein, contains DsbC and DsbD domains [Roseovarius marisflavi]